MKTVSLRYWGLSIAILLMLPNLGHNLIVQGIVNQAGLILVKDPVSDLLNTQSNSLLQRALGLNENNVSVNRLLFTQAILTHNANEAINYLQCQPTGQCDCMESVNLGSMYWDLGEQANAFMIWQNLLVDSPCSTSSLFIFLERRLRDTPHTPETAKIIELTQGRLLAGERLSVGATIAWGRLVFLSLKRADLADTWFRKADQYYPGNSGILYHLYNTSVTLGHFSDAQLYLDRLNESANRRLWMADVDLYIAHGTLAQAQAGQLDEAIIAYEQAVQVAPDSARARAHLATAYLLAYRCQDARQQYQVLATLPLDDRVNLVDIKKKLELVTCR
jgi:tetratricopeptide (TPR) repeat protein